MIIYVELEVMMGIEMGLMIQQIANRAKDKTRGWIDKVMNKIT